MAANTDYYEIASALLATQADKRWHQYVRHVIPDLIPASELESLPDDEMPKWVCARACSDVLKLASVHSYYITPRGENWLTFKASRDATSDEKDWLKRAAERFLDELLASNFYTAKAAADIDRVATGTGVMMAEIGKRGVLFTHVPAGTYVISENDDHEVDMLVRRFKFTPHQIVSRWGEAALSSEQKTAYNDPGRKYRDEYEIWHLVLPRDVPRGDNLQKDGTAGKSMPWADVYINPQTKAVLHEGGHYEFPYMVTRFLKYGNSVYGRTPLVGIQGAIRNVLDMREAMGVQAKAAAFPRVLATAAMVDELDLRAGGVTILRPEDASSQLPREWAASGQYAVGKDLLEMDYKDIDDALFVSILEVVSGVDRQMTATEVVSRERERVMTFGQSFMHYLDDLRPLVERVFCLLMRMGRMPGCAGPGSIPEGAPKWLFEAVDGEEGKFTVIAPGVNYLGRMAKSLDSDKRQGLQTSLEFALQMAGTTGDPRWLDYFKPYETMQFVTDEGNVPAEVLRTPKEAAKEQAKREQASAAAQAAQLQQMQAAANRDNAASLASMNKK